MADHSRLGRGLAALIGDVGDETSVADSGRKPRRAPVESLRPNPRNPRRLFTDTELGELSELDPRARHYSAHCCARTAR